MKLPPRPPIHARDHVPGGVDPIPGLVLFESASPYITQITTDAPTHWWRFREANVDDPNNYTVDVGFSAPLNLEDMVLSLNGAGVTEITENQPGPNPDLISMHRQVDIGFNASNIWDGQAAIGEVDISAGESFSYEGWWKLDALGEFDLFNWTGITDDYVIVNADGSLTLGRDGSTWTTAAGVIVEDEWRYICVVVNADDDTIKLYCNPASDQVPLIDETDPSTTTGGGVVFAVGTPNGAGGSGGAADGAPDGYITEVAVYTYALDSGQVRAHFVSGLYGHTGQVPIAVNRLEPGENGQHLVTLAGEAAWDTQVLDDIDDVNAPTPANGDVLTWDSTPGEWIASPPSSGSLDLDDLNDVTITSVADGDLLAYDSGSGDWINVDSGGAISAVDIQTYDSGTPTWTKPTGAKAVRVVCIGAGGSGGSGCNGNSTARAGGSGGGGGATTLADFDADDLSGTVSVTVGVGGVAKAGTNASAGTDGADGTASTFGSYVIAGGGGGGKAGGTSSQNGGGGAAQNASAAGTSGGTGQGGATGIAADAVGAQGPNGSSVGRRAEWGGGSGGGSANSSTGAAGGPAIFGGPGGGGGGGCDASNTGFAGADGGANGYGALGGGGAGGGQGVAGTGGSTTRKSYCGTGGGGGGGTSGGTGKNGGDGGPGAGGGGGGAGTNTNFGGDSGAGGAGRVIVITWL